MSGAESPLVLCETCAGAPDARVLEPLAPGRWTPPREGPALPPAPPPAVAAPGSTVPRGPDRQAPAVANPGARVEPPAPADPPPRPSDPAPPPRPRSAEPRVTPLAGRGAPPPPGVSRAVLPPPVARRSRSWPRVVALLSLLVAVAAWGLPQLHARWGARTPPAPVAAAESTDTRIQVLVDRIGPVPEPRTLLLVEAWRARLAGGPGGEAEAVRLAERAVARSPDDVESLALLAELYAEGDRDADLRAALLRRAETLGGEGTAPRRARAWIAWVEGREGEALAAAEDCLRVDPETLPCEVVKVATGGSARPAAERVAAADALLERWPEAPRLRPWSAKLAAAEGLPDAVARLEDLVRERPDDPSLRGALARSRLAAGDLAGAEAEATRLGEEVPAVLAVDLARRLVAGGAPDRARRWLGRLEPARVHPSLQGGMRTLQLQASLLAAREGDAAARDLAATQARESAATVEGVGGVQAVILGCSLVGDWACVERAWDRADPASASPRDRARLYQARAAAALARALPRDADPAIETALAADPRAPEGYLLAAASALASQDPTRALEALSRGVRRVDGSAARRRSSTDTLPVLIDLAALRQALAAAVDGDDARRSLGLAAVAWLGGQPTQAGNDLEGVELEGSAVAAGLQARLSLERGAAQRALAAADQALAVEPGEPGWHLLRAQALLAAGDLRRAQEALRVVQSAGGASSLAWTVEAEVAARRGDEAAVRAAALAAVEADPDDAEARALLARLGG